MVEVNDSIVSPDGALKATLTAFDPAGGKGRVRVEELSQERGWFYITVFGNGGQNRIDDKTWVVHKASTFEITTTVRNDPVTAIEIVRLNLSPYC